MLEIVYFIQKFIFLSEWAGIPDFLQYIFLVACYIRLASILLYECRVLPDEFAIVCFITLGGTLHKETIKQTITAPSQK